jgi:hypothetical protein
MKKLVLTAAFMLASFGAFAANNDVKSNTGIAPVKNNVEIVSISDNLSVDVLKAPPTCTLGINLGIVSFSYTWEC